MTTYVPIISTTMDQTRHHRPQSPLLNLPSELRLQILELALSSPGSIELQQPLWSDHEAYVNPLFAVCRSLRHEALAAFYKTNTFLWYIDINDNTRTDPTIYPIGDEQELVIPALPWRYPYLFQHLRRLYVRIYLSPESDLGVDNDGRLSEALDAFVRSLDYGRRLMYLNLFFTYGIRWSNTRSVTETQRGIVKSLSAMEVAGTVKVTCFDTYLRSSMESLALPRIMKASSGVDVSLKETRLS